MFYQLLEINFEEPLGERSNKSEELQYINNPLKLMEKNFNSCIPNYLEPFLQWCSLGKERESIEKVERFEFWN